MNEFAGAGAAMLARAVSDPRQEFGSFFLSRLLGFNVSYRPETCIVSFDAEPLLFNPQGSLHGGNPRDRNGRFDGAPASPWPGAGTTLEMQI